MIRQIIRMYSKPMFWWAATGAVAGLYFVEGIGVVRQKFFSRIPIIGEMERYKQYRKEEPKENEE
jgi:hypothetical protein